MCLRGITGGLLCGSLGEDALEGSCSVIPKERTVLKRDYKDWGRRFPVHKFGKSGLKMC